MNIVSLNAYKMLYIVANITLRNPSWPTKRRLLRF